MESDRSWILTLHGIRRDRIPDEQRPKNRWIDLELFTGLLDRIIEDPKHRMELSFDDGNLSDYELAFPELSKRGLSATFFILAGQIGKPGYVGPAEIKAMREGGMRIGSHGMNHVSWRGLSRAAAKQEFEQSRSILEDLLQEEVLEAACPCGLYNQRTLRQLRSAGFQTVYCSNRGPTRTTDFLQARNTVHASMTPDQILDEKLSYRINRLRQTRLFLKRFRYQIPSEPKSCA